MNILLIGSGAREHAFARKIKESPLCQNLYIAPGNPGTAEYGENIEQDPSDFDKIAHFCLAQNIEIIIPGSEIYLSLGISDYFSSRSDTKHITVIGPSKSAARIESSKKFSKIFMQKYGIPTAKCLFVENRNLSEGVDFLKKMQAPYVLKADGLAAGKGVFITENLETAQNELKEMIGGKFGKSSENVLLEEFMHGIEVSVFILTDGKNYVLLPEAKDYKRIGENDTGPNTGGMGAVSPVAFVDSVFMKKVEETIIKPTLFGLRKEGIDYFGFIFFGIMNVGGNPKVVEYNARPGDPETEAFLPRIESDILEMLQMLKSGKIGEYQIKISSQTAVTLVMASKGYPGEYEKGLTITGIDQISDAIVFHAGTRKRDTILETNGGRVFALTSKGSELEEALEKALRAAELINFEGKYYRKDIGRDLISPKI